MSSNKHIRLNNEQEPKWALRHSESELKLGNSSPSLLHDNIHLVSSFTAHIHQAHVCRTGPTSVPFTCGLALTRIAVSLFRNRIPCMKHKPRDSFYLPLIGRMDTQNQLHSAPENFGTSMQSLSDYHPKRSKNTM